MVKKIVINKLFIISFIIVFIIVGTISCFVNSKQKSQLVHKPEKMNKSAWIVDWQWNQGIQDVSIIANDLNSLQVFAANFTEQNKLTLSKQVKEGMMELHELKRNHSNMDIVVTIVNDVMNKDGSSVQKDSNLITSLVSTETNRFRHIEEIVNLVEEYDFDGVEIDYEKIKASDWKNTCKLYDELYKQLHKRGKTLRIVLEPRMPIEKTSLPQGPTYVMMAYNLYGTHSGPGPKADIAFLKKQTERMKKTTNDFVIAIALGGFDWDTNGKVTALTEKRATELSKQAIKQSKRDKRSGSMYFTYYDEQKVKHTVWYADHITIGKWIATLKDEGVNEIAFWRLGEVENTTLTNRFN